MKVIDWQAMIFGSLFALWLAADAFTGFYFGVPLPVRAGLIGLVICLGGLILIAVRNWRAALFAGICGAALIIAAHLLWKFAIHPTDYFKLVSFALLFSTPLILALGVWCLARSLKPKASPARSESAPSVLSR